MSMLKEKISNFYAGYQCGALPCPDACGNCVELTSDNECKEADKFAELIVKSLNLVQLDEDQELSDNEYWHKNGREFEAYCAGKNEMLANNFMKVKKEI